MADDVLREPAPWGVTILSDLGIITFDATLQESHTHSRETTRHPVEEGEPVADHRIAQPFELQLINITTLSPMEPAFAARDRDRRLYEALVELLEQDALCTVVTSLAEYGDLVVDEVAVPRSTSDGQAVIPALRMSHVRRAQSRLVGVPDEFLAGDVEPTASAEARTGGLASGFSTFSTALSTSGVSPYRAPEADAAVDIAEQSWAAAVFDQAGANVSALLRGGG